MKQQGYEPIFDGRSVPVRGEDSRFHTAVILAVIVAIAGALRLPGLTSEPWLDEIWSIDLARATASASGVFLKIHHDNNNPLNTLFLYFVSAKGSWATDRLLSFISGLLTIALLGWDPEDRARGLLTAALAAVSAPMVLYATEARGYAPLALFALGCFRLLRVRGPLTPARNAAFWTCALLAFLSHLTFVYVFAALVIWIAATWPGDGRLQGLLVLFGPPAVAFAAIALVQITGMQIGAANRNSFAQVVIHTLSLWAGAPAQAAVGVTTTAVLVGIIGRELWNLHRHRVGEFVFFSALFAGATLFVALLPFPFERHFFACLPFALMLAAGGLMRGLRRAGAARMLAGVFLVLFMVGNGERLRAFATDGRGHYLEAVQRMATETAGDMISVGSDHDFRNGMMLAFYGAYLSPPKRIDYVIASERTARKPEWYLRHSFSVDLRTVPLMIKLPGVASYRLIAVYPYGGLSGWMWMLYRRDLQ